MTFISDHSGLMIWLAIVSAAIFFFSLLSLPIVIGRLPRDFFRDRCGSPKHLQERIRSHQHPVLKWAQVVLRNLFGWLFVLCGLVMLVTPGQGLLTLLIGLVMIDFPRKQRVLCSLVSRPAVLNALNWVRRRAGHELFTPVRVDESADDTLAEHSPSDRQMMTS